MLLRVGEENLIDRLWDNIEPECTYDDDIRPKYSWGNVRIAIEVLDND